MANIVITKTGDIVSTTYNDVICNYTESAVNVVTGFYVYKLTNGGIESNILAPYIDIHVASEFDTIVGNTITTDSDLFTQLKALL